MSQFRTDRRTFLRGAGGAVVALPFLPSLDGDASAQMTAPKRFFYMGTNHGGIRPENMYPATPTTPHTILPDYIGHHAPLVASTSGANTVLSPVLTARSSWLTESVAKKMNVLRGIDMADNLAHNQGGHLGNNDVNLNAKRYRPRVTIDQLMAYSPSFYRTGDGMRQRSINIGSEGDFSWGYQDVTARTGVQKVAATDQSLPVFDRLFPGNAQPPGPAPRRSIMSRVLENYRSLRNGNRRLSQADRGRLDAHISRLSELEMNLTASVPISCGSPSRPNADAGSFPHNGVDVAGVRNHYRLWLDLVAAAFACGVSRIAVLQVFANMTAYVGNWHMDIAHQCQEPVPQKWLVEGGQQGFEHAFAYLAAKLDGITDADGKTVLDNSLLVWGQESGLDAHSPTCMPIVTAGSASGHFKTAIHVDYRDQRPVTFSYGQHHGLIYPQLQANFLDAMGIPRGEWEPEQMPGFRGYGEYNKNRTDISPGVYGFSGEKLPIVT